MNECIAMCLLPIAVFGSANAAEVRLRSNSDCSTAIVRLADVAEIHGGGELAMALSEVPLCPAPSAGNRRVLSQNDIRQLLMLSGVERAHVQITGSDAVTIAGNSASIRSAPVTLGAVSTMVRQAIFATESGASRNKPIVRAIPAPAISPPATAEIESPRIVERGASVMVHAQTAGVRIRTSGKALAAGAAGDMIAVELADSKEKVLARIVGPQVVEVAVSSAGTTR